MGAITALEAATRHPERVRALALLGVAERMPVHPDLLASAAANDYKAIAMVIGWGFGTHRGASAAPGMWQIGTGLRLMRQARPGVLANDLAACNAWKGTPDIRCPTTLILGHCRPDDPGESRPGAGGKIPVREPSF